MSSLPTQRATNLRDAYRICDDQPLVGTDLDRYYVDLSKVRKTQAIESVSLQLDLQQPGEFKTLLFTGHRGGGKSTELRRIGDVQGKATTLNNLAATYVDYEEVEEAIALYQEALDIFERMGNVWKKVVVLRNLARIYTQRGEMEEAIAFLQQSLTLLESLQSPDAETVRRMLAEVQNKIG